MTNESVEFEILINTFLFLALARENISIKMYITENRFVIHSTGKYAVCRHVCTVFSPDILQAGEVKGLRHSCNTYTFHAILPKS